jgi:hypothetical protein
MQTNVCSALYRQKLKLLHSFKQMEISARGYADKIVGEGGETGQGGEPDID